MNEPWFNPNLIGGILGATIGGLGGILGTLVGVLGPKGKAKRFVLGLWLSTMAFCAVLFALAIYAYLVHQPYGVWYGLGLAGGIGFAVLAINLPMAVRTYRMAEERKMVAKNL